MTLCIFFFLDKKLPKPLENCEQNRLELKKIGEKCFLSFFIRVKHFLTIYTIKSKRLFIREGGSLSGIGPISGHICMKDAKYVETNAKLISFWSYSRLI